MLLTIQNIQKYFGAELCLRNISCVLDAQDRAGIIGENGAGKTTLIKIITGELYPDDGIVTLAHGATVGYLEQNSVLDPACTVYREMENAFRSVLDAMDEMKRLERQMAECPGDHMLLERHAQLSAVVDAADGYNMDTQIKKILNGMAFPAPDYQKSVAVLSGGEHTRLCLAKLLLQKPDLLILDEPTNHLDFETMEWLESYLKTYPGAILVVSHDRYFLDAVCNRIFEIEDNTLTAYKGNYSAYLPQKEAAVALQQKQHDADMEKAAKLEDYIARNLVRASTTKMAQSRRKQLEKMEITEAPRTSHTDLKFRFTFDVTPYNEILTAKNISVTLGGKRLVEGLDLLVKRGERLVIAGPNGAGKSTLLRVLDGKLRPQAGTVRLGAGAKPSVFEQQQLRRGGTVISTIWDKYPKFTELEVRSHLAKLNFRGEDVFKPCSALSGGELARLRFAEILLEKPNLLFLDEPTNHLDLDAIAWLEEFLINFENTVIVVSHDRYFLNKVCTQIADIDYGKIQLYAGNYDFWVESSQLIIKQMKEANRKKEEKIKELQEFIQRFSANASKSKQATSRKRALEKIELDDIKPSSRKYPYIDFRPSREIGNEVLTVEHLSKTIDGEKVLDDISFILGREDKVALVGPNERAKTVLFKILSGEMEPDEGSYKWGLTTTQSYFPKDNSAEFANDDTIVEWLTQYSPEKDVTYVRGFLGRMLFAGEDGVKKVKVLSGGEKVRCMLSKLMISGANVLMLDEPTDHLDMESIDALNRGMIKFPGVMIFSSRDHQIVQTTANRIMEIINGKLIDKITTYDEYLESDEMARKRFTFTVTESDEQDD